nr:hypothetical protein [Tanacetum cinerariifolium]
MHPSGFYHSQTPPCGAYAQPNAPLWHHCGGGCHPNASYGGGCHPNAPYAVNPDSSAPFGALSKTNCTLVVVLKPHAPLWVNDRTKRTLMEIVTWQLWRGCCDGDGGVGSGGGVGGAAMMKMEGDVGGEVVAAEVMAAMVVMIKNGGPVDGVGGGVVVGGDRWPDIFWRRRRK